MRPSIIILGLLLTLSSCAINRKLERRQIAPQFSFASREVIDSQRKVEVVEQSTAVAEESQEVLVETELDENGDQIMSMELDEVVVVAKLKVLPERRGVVSIDFVVTLPREMQGSCQSVTVTPMLHSGDKATPLEELSIRGGLFSKVQSRNYWQFEQYVKRFKPNAMQEQRAFERFVKYPRPEGVRLDSIVEGRGELSYFYSQEVPTKGEGRQLRLTLEGRVNALDGSFYKLPASDTLQYSISSMLSFAQITFADSVERDSLYMRGVELLMDRDYAKAATILAPYRDLNSALAMISLGDDITAMELLATLEQDDKTHYLTAIVCARLGLLEQGRKHFAGACALNPTMEYRGGLDPEISQLIEDD
ncbi:MAG: hypothetical protein SNI45_08335 [Rikenellaceae bacterium]